MRAVFGGVIALVLGLGAVSDVAAQARAVVTRPAPAAAPAAAAPTGTHVVVPRAPGPVLRGPAANPLTTTQDIRIVTPGRPETRVIIKERRATGEPVGPGVVAPVARTPREVRVIVEQGAGGGAAPDRTETRIVVRSPDGERPEDIPLIVILPE